MRSEVNSVAIQNEAGHLTLKPRGKPARITAFKRSVTGATSSRRYRSCFRVILSASRVNVTGSRRSSVDSRSEAVNGGIITGDQNIKTCAFLFHRTPPFFSGPIGPPGRSCLQLLPSSTATAEQSSRQSYWRLSLFPEHRGPSNRIYENPPQSLEPNWCGCEAKASKDVLSPRFGFATTKGSPATQVTCKRFPAQVRK